MQQQAVIARAERARPSRTRPLIRLLLVEDCASDVFLVERMLEDVALNFDYEIHDVSRLVDAFDKVKEGFFNLILLDLNLIDIDGVASVAALHAEVPEIPIIVYSGMDDQSLKEKALMCGASHYMVKGRESAWGFKHVIENTLRPRN